MKQNNKLTGKIGEDLAERELRHIGLTILERNYSTRFGEIDIIARDKETLIFVEVKTKIGNRFGTPEEMISRGKLYRVEKMANVYLTVNNLGNPPCRIDVIAIVLNPDSSLLSLRHYPNARQAFL